MLKNYFVIIKIAFILNFATVILQFVSNFVVLQICLIIIRIEYKEVKYLNITFIYCQSFSFLFAEKDTILI